MSKFLKSRRGFIGGLLTLLGVSSAAKANLLSPEEVVRAWEDPKFRNTLTEGQWNAMPENPAGKVENTSFSGNMTAQSSGNNCSGNGCSGNGCSGNGCSGNGCSGNGCSGNGCSGNGCSGNSCSGNGCSGNNCGGFSERNIS